LVLIGDSEKKVAKIIYHAEALVAMSNTCTLGFVGMPIARGLVPVRICFGILEIRMIIIRAIECIITDITDLSHNYSNENNDKNDKNRKYHTLIRSVAKIETLVEYLVE
jgi:hypothetical protein